MDEASDRRTDRWFVLGCAGLLLVVGWWSRTFHTRDMDAFLLPWFSHIVDRGPVAAFSTPFSNYNPPYLYLLAIASPLATWMHPTFAIKLVSYAGHAFLGVAVLRLLRSLNVRHPARGAAAAMIAPTLLANPAMLVQCDALWAAPLVMALEAAVTRRNAAMLVWCGIALSFKLQAAFVAPFFLAIVLARRQPMRLWLLAPIAYAAMLLPAWAAGWPLRDLLTIYLRQQDALQSLVLNAPNLWIVVGYTMSPPLAAARFVAFLAAGIATAAFTIFWTSRLRAADGVTIVRAALICALIVPGLLPQMHERYFFMADVLGFVLAVAQPREWRLAVLTQAGSGLAILAYLTGIDELAIEGALAMLGATWFAIRPLLPVSGSIVDTRGQAIVA